MYSAETCPHVQNLPWLSRSILSCVLRLSGHGARLCVYHGDFCLWCSEEIEGQHQQCLVLRPSTAFYLTYLQSAKATADRKSASKPIGFEGDLRGKASDLPERLHPQEVDLASSQGDCLMAGNDSEEALTALMSRKTAISLFEGKALGLDKAILHSVDCCCKHTPHSPVEKWGG